MKKRVTKHKRQGRKRPWETRWYDNDGKRHSKFFETKEKRDLFADKIEQELEAHGSTILDVDFSEYQEYVYLKRELGDGVDFIKVVRDAAAKFIDTHRKPVAEVFDVFEEDRRIQGVSEDYLSHTLLAFRRFNKSFPETLISEITTDQVKNWLDSLKVGRETWTHYRKHIHAAFELALKRGWVAENVVRNVPSPEIVREEPEFYTVDEAQALLDKALEVEPRVLVPFALGLFAGMRSSSALRIEHSEVRLEDMNIVIPAKKAKKKRRLVIEHLPDNLWAWLKLAPKDGYLIPKREYQTLRTRIHDKAGVESKRNGFRHSFASYHVAWKGDAGQTATIIGHRGSVTTLEDNYRAQVEKALAEKYFLILPK